MTNALKKQIESILASGACTPGTLEAIRSELLASARRSDTPEQAIAIIDLLDQEAGQAAGLGMRNVADVFRKLRDEKRADFDQMYISYLRKRNRYEEAEIYESSEAGLSTLISVRDELGDLLNLDPSYGYTTFAESVGDFGPMLLRGLENNKVLFSKNFKCVSAEALATIVTHWPSTAEQIRRILRIEIFEIDAGETFLNPEVIIRNLGSLSDHLQKFVATPDELRIVTSYRTSSVG